MPYSRKLPLVAVSALAALTAAVATAATPSSGKVSRDAPSVTWEGTLANSAVTFNGFNNDDSIPCAPPACDTFALEVADGPANLELTVNLQRTGSGGESADAGFRITDPDGKITWVSGPSDPDKAFKHVIKGAKNGKYTIDTVDSFVGTQGTYLAKATLLIPGASTVTPTKPADPPANTQPGPSQPAQPLPTLKLKVAKSSAKKLSKSRKLSVSLTSSAPLTKIVGQFRKGKTTVGKGKLAKLDSTGKLTLKLAKKKLKAGSYKLTVQGLDAQNRTVTGTATVKVKK